MRIVGMKLGIGIGVWKCVVNVTNELRYTLSDGRWKKWKILGRLYCGNKGRVAIGEVRRQGKACELEFECELGRVKTYENVGKGYPKHSKCNDKNQVLQQNILVVISQTPKLKPKTN